MPKTLRRRRKEARTDYKSRFNLIKSEKQRLVIRKTNRYLVAQIVATNIAQDKVLVSVSSKDLLELGWPTELSGSLKSLPASYLTGMLIASKLNKDKNAILDLGMHRNISFSRIYALLKGAIDNGMDIPHKDGVFPTEEMILKNEKLSNIFKTIKEKLNNG